MKQILIATTMTLINTLAWAQFSMTANCHFNAGRGQCLVANTTGYILQCTLRAHGQLASGQFLEAWQNAIIYPGNFAYVYIYADNPYYNPLIAIRGLATCSL